MTASQLEAAIAAAQPEMMVLRAPGLDGAEYLALAKDVAGICEAHGTALLLHGNAGVAETLPGGRGASALGGSERVIRAAITGESLAGCFLP